MKTRHQNGHLYKSGGYWYVRIRQDEVEKDGQIRRKQRAMRIAPLSECKSKKAVEELRAEKVQELQLNSTTYNAQSTMPLSQYVDTYFIPVHVAQLKPSVQEPYVCLKPLCGDVRLRDFRPSTGQRVIDEAAKKGLGRNTIKRLKSLLSGMFSEAIRIGALDKANPMREVRIPSSRLTAPEDTHAYSLEQVSVMLRNMIGPVRALIAVFAYTGLRKGEVAALRWENWRDDSLWVEQSLWRGQFTEPKSHKSKAPVPVIGPLAKILKEYREGKTDGLMFRSRTGTALDLDNFGKRKVIPLIKKLQIPWYGWHAFRRGLATNLNSLGIEPTDIQAIMRHADFQTTMNHYVKTVPESAKRAMGRLETLVCTDCAPESEVRVV
jgi:integrase